MSIGTIISGITLVNDTKNCMEKLKFYLFWSNLQLQCLNLH